MSQEIHTSPSVPALSSQYPRRLRDKLIAINEQHEQVFAHTQAAPSIENLSIEICAIQPTGLAAWEKHLPTLQARLASPLQADSHDTPVDQTLTVICAEFRRDIPEGSDVLEQALARAIGIPDPQALFTTTKFPLTPLIHAYYLALRTKEEQANLGTHNTQYAEQSREMQQPLTKSLLSMTQPEFIVRAVDLLHATINMGRMIMGDSARDIIAYRFYTELKGIISAAIAHTILQQHLLPGIEQYLPSVRMDQLGVDIAQLHVDTDTLTAVTSSKSSKKRTSLPPFAAGHGKVIFDMSSHVQPIHNASGKLTGYGYFVPMLVTPPGNTNPLLTIDATTYYTPTFDANGKLQNPFKPRPRDLMPCPVRLTEDVYASMQQPTQTLEVNRDATTVIAFAVNYGPFEEAQDALGSDYEARSSELIRMFYDFQQSLVPQPPTVMN